ncbi:uroporphyrinogen-III synthase [Actinomyces naeslundii]|uniref:Uroporphyrinogen-III synthase n=1 Tax=Actinomyces naeslundii TaxID=1655 RepID=A0A854D9K1_ACTNA|nr:uroporphyrinogen-III synthase [Actinomyces naeslundii]OMG36842.1 uroporphyrinogen-III synthase [Actinomyces naeslundii]
MLRHPPDEPREAADAPLAGQVVLLPRVKEPDRIASALERAGAEVQRAAVTRTVPGETAALEATARRIVAGEAAWLVLTSARTVEALAPYLHVPVPSALQVAVVGPATARAWTELTGAAPDLVSRGSAAALLEEPVLVGPPPAPSAAKRVLLPASALADPALADGLRRAGWEVEQVSAYTTVTAGACDLPPGLDDSWAASGVDAVVLTAPSSTRAVLELLGPPPSTTRLVTIGATTAAAARELGLPVAAIAPSPTPEGVLRAVIAAMTPDPAIFTTPPSRSTS